MSIINDGIRNVGGGWGEGELGAEFYTATTVAGGASYLPGAGAVIKFVTNAEMKGVDVIPPRAFPRTIVPAGDKPQDRGQCPH